jgi:SRSO17 transposase
MTEQQLGAIEPALQHFLHSFLFCCDYTQTFDHLGTYVRGLLSDLPRKSVEPIALQAGTPVRTLQEFLRDHRWDGAAVRSLLQRHTADVLARLPDDGLGTVGLIDETSTVKDGRKTPGVQRQYLGCVGKVANGIVTVHLGVSRGSYQTLVDADLFLPPSWAEDRPRCRQAGILDDLVYRPKWQIALEQLDRARGNGVHLDWLTFDEGYGHCPGFVAGLDERQQSFVGEVPRTFSCLAARRDGQQPDASTKGRPAEEVVRAANVFRTQPWQVLRLPRQTLADQVWRVKAAPVWLSAARGLSARTYWLIWASNDETGEEKFFLSNASVDARVEVLMRVAFRRAVVEHSFRVCKTELGFGHFEGRRYQALMRHLTLCLVALAFAAEHTQQLRGEKSGTDRGTGLSGRGGIGAGAGGEPAAKQSQPVRPTNHRIPPGTQPRVPTVQTETARNRTHAKKTSPDETETTQTIHSKVKVALYC